MTPTKSTCNTSTQSDGVTESEEANLEIRQNLEDIIKQQGLATESLQKQITELKSEISPKKLARTINTETINM